MVLFYAHFKIYNEIIISLLLLKANKLYYDVEFIKKAIWPSGKAVDCKSSIPSSNLGVALNKMGVWWNGRHNRLKIC